MGAPVQVGDVLAEKYEVTKILGQGGMGIVVAARHRELDKLVALKFMHEDVARNVQAIDRFLREARAAARLQNEHVARVFDVGRMPSGVPYIVMEYLEGRDLSEVANERGPLSVAEVCEYMLQTCEAMAEAHAQGIIHRDLKPQNLFLSMRQDGRPLVKVLDFGISKAQFTQGPTATHSTMGSPAYMSPEQIRSARSVDQRADIWSFGVILYQLLSNTLPFIGETVTETMLKVISDPLPSLTQARPGLPPRLVAAVEKCLEKDRDKRFANVAELAHELTPYAPERARAAMSLIERVVSAGAAQQVSPQRFTDDHNVAPSVATTVPPTASPHRSPAAHVQTTVPPTASPHRSPAAHVQTTLGTAAAQSLDVEPRRLSGSRRWLAVFTVGIVAAVGIAVVPMGGGDSKPGSSPTPDAAVGSERRAPPLPPADAAPIAIDRVDATEAVVTTADTPKVGPKKPDSKKPDSKKRDPKKRDPKKPDLTKPEATKADPIKPDPMKLDDVSNSGSGSVKKKPELPRSGSNTVNLPR